MKILIADDERMVRTALRSMIEELMPDDADILEVKNGAQLAEQAPEFQPDIGFVDIAMPVCTGLEALARCRDKTPDTIWVILTCYAEFDYAQNAIRQGVSDYLLKPIDTEKLSRVLADARQTVRQRRRLAGERFREQATWLYNISQYDELSGEDTKPLESFAGDWCAIVLAIDNAPDSSRVEVNEVVRMLRSKTEKLPAETLLTAEFFTATGELCQLAAGTPRELERLRGVYSGVCALSTPAQAFSAVYRDDCKSALEMINAIDGLCASVQCRCLQGFGQLTRCGESTRRAGQTDELVSLTEQLLLAYSQSRESEYMSAAAKLKKLEESGDEFFAGHSAALKSYVCAALGIKPEQEPLWQTLENQAEEMYRKSAARPETDVVDTICAFIEANYAEDIGVSTLAESCGITPNYLSRIFKQKTGTRFVDYLTDVRIVNAKRLLSENPDAPVREIASQVGYFSVRHFTKLFQRIVGCNPSQFSRKLKS